MFLYNKLVVYQKAFALNKRIYQLLKKSGTIPPYVKNQLGRSTLSIMLNIAEGNGKAGKRDKRNFLIIARASTFETAALVDFLASEKEIEHQEANSYQMELEEISKMLIAIIKSLE
ncbi:MAG: ribosomal protein [Chitinophagaceae bacterium]|nr:ribosomal protein [Chitinophagaceae bacterium]